MAKRLSARPKGKAKDSQLSEDVHKALMRSAATFSEENDRFGRRKRHDGNV
jgi:hypothetical protein